MDIYMCSWLFGGQSGSTNKTDSDCSKNKVFKLFEQICSMSLNPSSAQCPYEKMIVMDERKSFIPDGLKQEEIIFIRIIHKCVENHLPKGCILDLLWMRTKEGRVEYALKAIDAYMDIPLNASTWDCGGGDCCHRSLVLIKKFKDRTGNQLKRLEDNIVKAIREAVRKDVRLFIEASRLLREYRIGSCFALEIAEMLENIAKENKIENSFFLRPLIYMMSLLIYIKC